MKQTLAPQTVLVTFTLCGNQSELNQLQPDIFVNGMENGTQQFRLLLESNSTLHYHGNDPVQHGLASSIVYGYPSPDTGEECMDITVKAWTRHPAIVNNFYKIVLQLLIMEGSDVAGETHELSGKGFFYLNVTRLERETYITTGLLTSCDATEEPALTTTHDPVTVTTSTTEITVVLDQDFLTSKSTSISLLTALIVFIVYGIVITLVVIITCAVTIKRGKCKRTSVQGDQQLNMTSITQA